MPTTGLLLICLMLFEVILLRNNCEAKINIHRKKIYKTKNDVEKCYRGLGCVKLTAEWTHPKLRPLNAMPMDRHIINTVFVRWKSTDGLLDSEILGSNLSHSGIESGNLKILIHDFTSNGYAEWIEIIAASNLEIYGFVGEITFVSVTLSYMHMARKFLMHDIALDVVSVNWVYGAEPPYIQAVANARLVSLEVIKFLDKLKDSYLLQADQVHVIGHGLGAHIAGYVGKVRRLKRITALDPTGLYFSRMPPKVRLHRDDAKYVEVIHTSTSLLFAVGQGNSDMLGHVDYYPNGGTEQPGCMDTEFKLTEYERGDLEPGQSIPACSHKRSLKYYIEALVNPTCTFLGIACPTYKEFLMGRCATCGKDKELCSGLRPLEEPRLVNNTFGFYFVTSSSTPFCGEILKASVKFKPYKDIEILKHFLQVTIPQDVENVTFFLNENNALSKIELDQMHTFLVFRLTPPPLILPTSTVHFEWIPRSRFMMVKNTPPQIVSFKLEKMSDRNDGSPQEFCAGSNDKSMKICNRTSKSESAEYIYV